MNSINKKNNKLAFAINELDVIGGTHKQLLRLCEYCESQNIGFQIHTKNFDIAKTYKGFDRYNVISEKSERAGVLGKAIQEIRMAMKVDPKCSVVNVHDNGLSLFSVICRLRGKKIVWQINDVPHSFNIGASVKNKSLGARIKSSLKNVYYRYVVAPLITRVTVNVTKNRVRVLESLGLRAEVFYCGVDLPQSTSELSIREPSKTTLHLLSTGVFFPHRNYEAHLEIVKKLIESGEQVKLNIVGSMEKDKAYAAGIVSKIRDLGIRDHVNLLGQVSDEKLAQLYSKSDIFLFLNVDQSWGLAVFEAMGRGIPVLVSNSVGATEILEDGVHALFVEPKDEDDVISKIRVLSDPAVRTKMVCAAREYVKTLSWDNTYSSKMVAVFQQIGLR